MKYLIEISGEFWLCYKHPDGHFVAERKATPEDIEKINTPSESYPAPWIHATIHLNPETGEIHSDGDHQVRHWIQEKISTVTTNLKKEHIDQSLLEICKTVNLLEQKVSTLRDLLDFGITGKSGLRGISTPDKAITYTKEIIGYLLKQLDESDKYMQSQEYKQRL